MQLKNLLQILIVSPILLLLTTHTSQSQDFNLYEDVGITGPKFSITYNRQIRSNEELFVKGQNIPFRAENISLNGINARIYNKYLFAFRLGVNRKVAKVNLLNHFGTEQSLTRKDWRLLVGADYHFDLGDVLLYSSFYIPIIIQSDNPDELEYDYLRNWLGQFDRMRTAAGINYTYKQHFAIGLEFDVNLAHITERFRDTWNFYTASEMLETQYSLMLTLGFHLPH